MSVSVINDSIRPEFAHAIWRTLKTRQSMGRLGKGLKGG
jgi:hypothetical protein